MAHESRLIATIMAQPGWFFVRDDGCSSICNTFALRDTLAGMPGRVEHHRYARPAVSTLGGALREMDPEASRRQLAAALVRVAAGDRAALRMVYEHTSAKLFGVCVRILNDRGEAEDLLQEVYVTVWRKAGSFDAGRASPITWLVSIARNRAIDRLRSGAGRRRMEPIEAADAVSDPAPAAIEQVEMAQQRQRLTRCLEELEARHSAAIRAAFLDGATYEELATRMSVPLGTMKSWIRRGLLKLRACLEA
jgi:RNA polymerase sigma factor (sigma-70 family)